MPKELAKHLLWVGLWGGFWKRLTFDLNEEGPLSAISVGLVQSLNNSSKTKRLRENKVPSSSYILQHQEDVGTGIKSTSLWFLDSQPWAECYIPSVSLVSGFQTQTELYHWLSFSLVYRAWYYLASIIGRNNSCNFYNYIKFF